MSANPQGGILGASSSPFAQSLSQSIRGPQASMTLGGGPAPLSQAIDPNVLAALTAQSQARNAQFGSGPVAQAPQSNPTGAPQPVPQPIQQMQPISAPQSLGGQMGGGMTGPQFPGQGGGQGGIGSLLEPIQAHLIQRYNEAKVVPLLNNFERQLMQLGSPQGGIGGYGGEPQRLTTMGPGSFGPPITSLQAQQRARVQSRVQFEPGFDASAYLQ